MQSKNKERMWKLKLHLSITISNYQTSDLTVSDHTAIKTFKDERQKQRRWISGAFQQAMVKSTTNVIVKYHLCCLEVELLA